MDFHPIALLLCSIVRLGHVCNFFRGSRNVYHQIAHLFWRITVRHAHVYNFFLSILDGFRSIPSHCHSHEIVRTTYVYSFFYVFWMGFYHRYICECALIHLLMCQLLCVTAQFCTFVCCCMGHKLMRQPYDPL